MITVANAELPQSYSAQAIISRRFLSSEYGKRTLKQFVSTQTAASAEYNHPVAHSRPRGLGISGLSSFRMKHGILSCQLE